MLPKRKNNRLQEYDYSQNGGYFITICTAKKQKILGEIVGEDSILPYMKLNEIGKVVEIAINNIEVHYPMVCVEKFVIMPNHVHILLLMDYGEDGRMLSSPTTISNVVGQMKRSVSKEVGSSIWQRSFHDHIIRGEKDYKKIWEYMDTNTLKWKLDCFYTE